MTNTHDCSHYPRATMRDGALCQRPFVGTLFLGILCDRRKPDQDSQEYVSTGTSTIVLRVAASRPRAAAPARGGRARAASGPLALRHREGPQRRGEGCTMGAALGVCCDSSGDSKPGGHSHGHGHGGKSCEDAGCDHHGHGCASRLCQHSLQSVLSPEPAAYASHVPLGSRC